MNPFEALALLLVHRRRELEATPPLRLSETTLEVCLRAVTIEARSFVEGGTFSDDAESWRDFADTATTTAPNSPRRWTGSRTATVRREHAQIALDILREVRDGELLPSHQEPSTGGPTEWADRNPGRFLTLHRAIEDLEDELAKRGDDAARSRR